MSDALCKTCPSFSPKRQTEFREECDAPKGRGYCHLNPPVHGFWAVTWEECFCASHPDHQPHLDCAAATR